MIIAASSFLKIIDVFKFLKSLTEKNYDRYSLLQKVNFLVTYKKLNRRKH